MADGNDARLSVWVGQRWAPHAPSGDAVRIMMVDPALDVVEIENDAGVIACGPIAQLVETHHRLDQT
jgi:hypothetical protein